MHQLIPLKAKIALVVVLAAVTSGIASTLGAGPLSITGIVGVLELVIALLLLHSWPLMMSLPHAFRPAWMKHDLNGIWSGRIESLWTSPTEQSLAPIPVTVRIAQTWREFVVEATTDKMSSRSLCAVPYFDPVTKELVVRYFFSTDPVAAHRAENPPQQLGAAVLKLRHDTPDHIAITYTNERGHGGDIALRRKTQTSRIPRANDRRAV